MKRSIVFLNNKKKASRLKLFIMDVLRLISTSYFLARDRYL